MNLQKMLHHPRISITRFLVCGLSTVGVIYAQAPPAAAPPAPAIPSVTGTKAMVVSAHPEASRIGADILRQGGNAVDAAVAVSFAVGVLRPQSTGIGGGGFLLLYRPDTEKTQVYDFRERAPRRATRDMYLVNGEADPALSRTGYLSVAVPGLVDGMVTLHRDHGKLPFARLLQPAIDLAQKGFPVYEELAKRLRKRQGDIAANASMKALFFKEGRPLAAGDRLVQEDLARTLTAVAAEGRDGFYAGPVADRLVHAMQQHGGLIDHGDLQRYRTRMRPPVQGTYRGYTIVSMPPPSSGGTHLIQLLNLLEGLDLNKMKLGSAPATHYLVEAMRHAYADRAHYMGDPEFVDIPLYWLLSKEYAATVRKGIDPGKAGDSATHTHGTVPPSESPSTTHFSIVDTQGWVLSSTQTINYSFGACVVPEGTGIILNDEMDDFSAQPGKPNLYGLVGGEANAIAPGKTPLSSMSPTLVFKDRRPVMALGSPGGSRIITAVLQTMVHAIDYKLAPADAVGHPRLHHQWLPDEVVLESGYAAAETRQRLEAMGHTLVPATGTMGDVQAIFIGPEGLTGISDPRGSGGAAGY